ncbi:hypothetical protein V1520DRAFT_108498 [Lipomyces starkeyi]|uniref:Uncharacterized protein n=1 Tax=Lipomyces starkeyi NRRL Y-11557 TaxID=675824 RepID=A0A1E3Q0Y1_LIPST|nr:hypothetical protein LIPSTDRAFT_73945 [Lipomyces starkeyi NRRL Y-11557]
MDATGSTPGSVNSLSVEQVNSLPETLQRKLNARRELILREIETFKEHKLREFDLFQNELWRTFAREQKQQEIASNRPNSYLSPGSHSIPSSLKGNNKRQRNGEKKKVMFRLAEEIPPVSPGADIVPDTSSPAVVPGPTDVDYFPQLHAKMSVMSLSALDEPEEEMIEDADALVEDTAEMEFVEKRAERSSLPAVASDESADTDTDLLRTPEDENMKVRSLPGEMPELGKHNGMLSSSAPSSYLGFNKRSHSKHPSNQFTPIQGERFDTESDDVFVLDESLHFSSDVERPSFRRSGGKLTSFSDLYSAGGPFAPQSSSGYAFSQGDGRVTITSAPSGWTGNSASFHTQAPLNNLAVPIPQQNGGSDSNLSSLDEDLDGNMANAGISTFGSSLPIEIDPQPGIIRRLSKDSRLHDDSGEMGLPGGVLGEDEEYQLEKIKSFENPDRLSFSRRIMWEQHVGSHQGR